MQETSGRPRGQWVGAHGDITQERDISVCHRRGHLSIEGPSEHPSRLLGPASPGRCVTTISHGSVEPPREGEQADVIVTGKWSQNTLTEMNKIRRGNSIWDGAEGGFNRIPSPAEYKASGDSIYVHYTSNNTIYGTQFRQAPDCDGRPLVVDASSDICGVPLDVSAHEVIYAGAQKNLGPSGVTVCILSPGP